MDRDELLRLLHDLESDRVERTQTTRDTDKFGEAICAFANDLPNHRAPGYLFIGVDREGKPTGIEVTERLLEALGGIRSDGNLLPPPAMTIEKVDLPEGSVVVVEVQPSHATPVSYRGRIYIRIGPRRGIANAEDERLLSEKRAAFLNRTWDSRPCAEAALDDLALDLFTLTYRRAAVAPEVVAENERPIEHQLAALRFYDLAAAKPTNAALLLFGRDPLFFTPGAYLQYVHYSGPTQAAEVIEERRLSGDLLNVLRGLEELARDLATARPVHLEGFREETIFGFPPRALRELLVNAVIHRAYEGSTAPVQISQFEDRLEILNPGGLYPGLTPERFPKGTAYRNPVLAEAARVLGYANRFGRGIAVAEDELRRNLSPPLKFDLGPHHFQVTVGRRP